MQLIGIKKMRYKHIRAISFLISAVLHSLDRHHRFISDRDLVKLDNIPETIEPGYCIVSVMHSFFIVIVPYLDLVLDSEFRASLRVVEVHQESGARVYIFIVHPSVDLKSNRHLFYTVCEG
jgi:hypothetical protein